MSHFLRYFTSSRGLPQQKVKNEQYEVDNDMLKLVKTCLPPNPPAALSRGGESDVSLFVSTYNMRNCKKEKQNQFAYWLPHGFDIYVISVQSCANVSQLGPKILDVLQSQGGAFQEYMHFIKTGANSSLVVCFYVSSELVQEGIFSRGKIQKLFFSGNLRESKRNLNMYTTTTVKGEDENPTAFIIGFKVFDTDVMIVNLQLSKGDTNQDTRVDELNKLIRMISLSAKPDQIILTGDFNCCNLPQLDNDKLRNYISVQNLIPKWTNDRFKFLLEEFDEINTTFKTEVNGFDEFKEAQINYPPTSLRAGSFLDTRELSTNGLAQLFHKKFDLDALFKYDKNIPAYPDRILYRSTSPELEPCLKAGVSGTLEGMCLNSRVPVFCTFRLGSKIHAKAVSVVPSLPSTRNATKKRSDFEMDTMREMRRHGKADNVPSKFNNTPEFEIGDMPPPPTPTVASRAGKVNRAKLFQSNEPPPPIPPTTVVGNSLQDDQDFKALHQSNEMDALTIALNALSKFSSPKKKVDLPPPPAVKKTIRTLGSCMNCYNTVLETESHLEIDGKLFHQKCFECVSCDKKITGAYYFVNDHLYCVDCYQDLFNPYCLGCDKRIDGPQIKTEKGSYHLKHFQCTKCSLRLADLDEKGGISTKDFAFVGNELRCVAHASSGRNCFVCTKDIEESTLVQTIVNSSELLNMHQDCFKCSLVDCQKLIKPESNGKYWYMLKDDKILCGEHALLRCAGCDNKIFHDEKFSELFGLKYHKQCIPTCSNCSNPLASKDKIIQDQHTGKLMCDNCAMKESDVHTKTRSQSILPSSLNDVRFVESGSIHMRSPKPKRKQPQEQRPKQARNNIRSNEHVGFKAPPRPTIVFDDISDSRTVSYPESDFDSVVYQPSYAKSKTTHAPSVATNITQAAALGDQLVDLLSNLNAGAAQDSSWEDMLMPPPPPPPPGA